jgi:phosphoenolpyruvate synthase/pyruvate phosphate dikinase
LEDYTWNSLLSKLKNVIFPRKFILKIPYFSVRDEARRRLAGHGSLQKEKEFQLLIMNNLKY